MRSDLAEDPIQQFECWFDQARRSFWLEYPEAFVLGTVDPQGSPDGRVVLLKDYDQSGFVFYTNTLSRKGESLGHLPRASLTFYWEPLMRQVRIQGEVEPVTAAEADTYFTTRPRLSQIGAWASQQSQPIDHYSGLDQRVHEFRVKYKGRAVPRPPHWSGYRIKPDRFEFWQLRPSRLHDRFAYTRDDSGSWVATRLNP